jgi:hypothetical protein
LDLSEEVSFSAPMAMATSTWPEATASQAWFRAVEPDAQAFSTLISGTPFQAGAADCVLPADRLLTGHQSGGGVAVVHELDVAGGGAGVTECLPGRLRDQRGVTAVGELAERRHTDACDHDVPHGTPP